MAAKKLGLGLLITVSFLALYAAYVSWVAAADKSWAHAVAAVMAVTACIGTARTLRWSRFIVYLVCATLVGGWGYSVYDAARAGYFQPLTAGEISISLAPGALLVAVACFCSYAVFRHFRTAPHPPGLHPG